MKKIPIGRDNFKDIIEGDFYYVDKTKIIEELLERGSYITLFPRPRRFGKSLMISTLQEFFDVEKKESNKNLFEGLYISKSKYYSEQNKYPVIKLNFKSLKSDSWEDMYETIRERFAMVFETKRYLLDILNEEEKDFYFRILRKQAEKKEYEACIEKLSQFMERYYKEKVILLIDEYDVPIQTGYTRGFYNDVIGFIKNLFGNTLKTNDSVKFAVMTGILRVSKESIFSDLNNVKIYSIVENRYNEFFGFTEEETRNLLEHYKFNLNTDVKNMYDGYIFGKQEIYNPWSILNYVEDGNLYPYWVNTSADELLRQLFDNSKDETAKMLEDLILGKTVEVQYNEKVTFLDLKAVQTGNAIGTICNFLLFAGYLTKANKEPLDSNGYIALKIPNNEVRTVYRDVITNWITSENILMDNDLLNLSKFFKNDEKENIEKILNKALQSMSFFDSSEGFYHGYSLALFTLFLNRDYVVKSNREAGKGRLDVMIEKLDRSFGIVVEFKYAKEDEDLEKMAIKGKDQIMEKEYYKELEVDRVEKILTYSIAFKGKECKVI